MADTHHTYSVESSAYDTRVGLVIHFQGATPDFVRWSLIIADCVSNLRSSLDHLIYAVAQHYMRNQLSSDIEHLAFIITDSPEKFRDRNNRKRLRGLSDRVISAIEHLQPFKRAHPTLPPLLKILREFSNADKHRLLQLAAAGVSDVRGVIRGTEDKGNKTVRIKPDPIEDNDIICVIESSEPDPQLAFIEIGVAIEVSLWHGLRDGDVNPLHTRTGYKTLIPMLIEEVRFAINQVRSSI